MFENNIDGSKYTVTGGRCIHRERDREYYIYNFLMEEKLYIKQCDGKPVRLKVTGMSDQALSIAMEGSVAIIKREKLLHYHNTSVLSSGCFRLRGL